MKYLLNVPYSLRGWRGLPHALCENGTQSPKWIQSEEFMFLAACNGKTELQDSDLVRRFLEEGVICAEGGELKAWQKYRLYDNQYFHAVSFAPTLRCNYNCRHCFNAKDENKAVAQMSYEECLRLYDAMQECGIGTLRYTGGEPFVHPQFMEILLEAHRRGFHVEEILTNGAFITQEVLEKLRNEPPAETEFGAQKALYPLIMISFDGLGTHDWLRGVPGAEEATIRAMKRVKQYGFNLAAHVCIHKGNVDGLMDTAKFLSDLGVNVIRVIRVSEAPRWVRTSADYNLPPEEYYEKLVAFFSEYRKTGLKPMLELWGVLRYFPMYDGRVDWLPKEKDRESLLGCAVCSSIRDHMHISAEGKVYPCNIMSGVMRALGDEMPSVLETPLKELLQDSSYLDRACLTFQDMFDAGSECGSCEWFDKCQGGCRAVGYANTQSYYGPDYMRCILYKGGFAEKFMAISQM